MATTSPIPPRRTNNGAGRSRSLSPAANITSPQPALTNAEARNNFLNPENSNLYRSRRSTSSSASNREGSAVSESIPLIRTEKMNPPLANQELDDLGDEREVVNSAQPGVDDGFFSNRSNADGVTVPALSNNNSNLQPTNGDSSDDLDGRRVFPSRGVSPRPPMSPSELDFYGPDGKSQFPDLEIGTIPLDLESIPDVNVYQHKKTLAQGMMDLALFSANANQLRYVLESNLHPYFYPGVVLISISLILQVAIGVGLIWNSRYNVKDEKQICIANKINNFTIIGIFLVTVVNVFISAFGVASVQPVAAATQPVVAITQPAVASSP